MMFNVLGFCASTGQILKHICILPLGKVHKILFHLIRFRDTSDKLDQICESQYTYDLTGAPISEVKIHQEYIKITSFMPFSVVNEKVIQECQLVVTGPVIQRTTCSNTGSRNCHTYCDRSWERTELNYQSVLQWSQTCTTQMTAPRRSQERKSTLEFILKLYIYILFRRRDSWWNTFVSMAFVNFVRVILWRPPFLSANNGEAASRNLDVHRE